MFLQFPVNLQLFLLFLKKKTCLKKINFIELVTVLLLFYILIFLAARHMGS